MQEQNATFVQDGKFYKDYIVKEYEKIVQSQNELLSSKIKEFERTKRKDELLIEPGTILNDGTLVMGTPYLDQFKLTFDPDDELPIIGVMTREMFRECLEKTDLDHVEKIISFSKSIPGFEYISKSAARRLINLFTIQKI